jgi:O-antigen/teichoic acid export membrane protein
MPNTPPSVVPGFAGESVFRNGRLIFVARVGGLCVSLAIVRVLVARLGIQSYGLCETLISLLTMSSIGSAVVGGVILRESARLVAQKKLDALLEAVRTGIGASLLWGCCAGAILVAVGSRVAICLGVPLDCIEQYERSMMIIALALPAGALAEVFSNLLSGLGRSGAGALIAIGCASLGGILSVVLCFSGLGIPGFAIGQVVAVVLSACMGFAACKRRLPGLSLCPKFSRTHISGGVLRYAGFLAVGSIALMARDSTDKLLVAGHASAEWAALIGISQRMCIPITLVCTMIYVPTVASAASLAASHDRIALRRIHESTSRFLALFAGILGIAVFGLHQVVSLVWLGSTRPALADCLYWVVSGMVFAIILTGALSSILKGAGLIRPELWYIVIGLVMNATLKYFWLDTSAVGSIMASAVSWAGSSAIFALLAIRIPWMSRRVLLESLICGALFIVIISAMASSRVLGCDVDHEPFRYLTGAIFALTGLSVVIYAIGCFMVRGLIAQYVPSESACEDAEC